MQLQKAIEGFILDAKGGTYSPAYIPTIESQCKRIIKFFNERALESLTLDDWKSYLRYLRYEYKPVRFNGDDAPLSEATVDNHWKMIRAFYNWCADNNILSTDRPDAKLPRPKYQNPEIVPFTPEEVKRLLDASQSTLVVKQSGRTYKIKRQNADRDKSILLMLLDTGMRIGELHRLRIGDVNLENGEVYIRPMRDGRKSAARTIYLGTRARQAVWKYIAKEQTRPDQSRKLFDYQYSYLRHIVRRIGKNAGVPRTYPHRFRHTFAIFYLRNHGDVFTLQRLLGHKDITMTLRYVNIVKADLAEAHRTASPVDNWKL